MASPVYAYMATQHSLDEVISPPEADGDPWEWVSSTPITRVQRRQTIPSVLEGEAHEVVSNVDVLVLCVTWRKRV